MSEEQWRAIEEALKEALPLTGELQIPAISPTLGATPDPLVKTIRYVDP